MVNRLTGRPRRCQTYGQLAANICKAFQRCRSVTAKFVYCNSHCPFFGLRSTHPWRHYCSSAGHGKTFFAMCVSLIWKLSQSGCFCAVLPKQTFLCSRAVPASLLCHCAFFGTGCRVNLRYLSGKKEMKFKLPNRGNVSSS